MTLVTLQPIREADAGGSAEVSIVIPTFNHLDLLKPCIESIREYTDLKRVEVVIVSNGCRDGTPAYLETLPAPFRSVVRERPLGFTAAANEGIRAAKAPYVLLLNNDVVLLPQARHAWIETLMAPFRKDPKVGLSGPVKFSWECGKTRRRALAFWCVLIARNLFSELGPLDEIFTPGMGEDGDFSIRAEEAGYKLAQVPVDGENAFRDGISSRAFPIYHVGSGTFGERDHGDVARRNTAILERRWGGKKGPRVSIVIPTCHHFEDALKPCVEAVLNFTDLSDKEVVVVANGSPPEAISYLKGKPVRLLEFPERLGYIRAINAGIEVARGDFVVTLDDDSFLQPQERDRWIGMLMEPFDSAAVAASGPFSTVYDDLGRTLHSGCTMYRTSALRGAGCFDEAFNPGYMGDEDLSIRLRKAGFEIHEVPRGQQRRYVNGTFEIAFPVVHTGTINTMPKHTTDLPLVERNRKLLYARHGKRQDHPKVSIVIPTFNHLEDLLKPCLTSIADRTDLSDVEVVVVANGCTDGTEKYVESLGGPFRVVSFPDALGYTRATNEGIKVARGDYLVFFNNDNELLPQDKNDWLEKLLAPFESDPTTGITGPLQLHDDYADEDVIIGFCLCVSRKVMQEAMADTGGLLDETFSPGGGEDIDLCCKVRRRGYRVRQVPKEGKLGFSHTNTGDFPIWHKNNQTFKDIEEYTRWYVKRNGYYNMKRYNRNVRLNLGSGGIEYPGYLSVDLNDRRAAIVMDATKLDLDEGSVAELLVLHLFEHLNPYKALDVLKGWLRVLKPGGKLVMEMPDVEQLCKRFAASTDTGERYGILNAVYGSVNTTDSGDPSEITSPHLFGWWPQSISDHLVNAGFVNVKFGPEQFPHPESNMHVEAEKPRDGSMLDLWNYAGCENPAANGDDTTYAKAMAFLEGCATVEDWGCGTAYAKRFLHGGRYVGVDGSRSKFCDVVADLRSYSSKAEGILLRHVLEHNRDWRKVLANAVASFREKLAIVVFTPFGEETRQIATNWSDIPDISFRRDDLMDVIVRFGSFCSVAEETCRTATLHGQEHVFYVTRR